MKRNKRKRLPLKRCAEICNDIHEGCCRASRKELMEAVSALSLRNAELWSSRSTIVGQIATHALNLLAEDQKHDNALP